MAEPFYSMSRPLLPTVSTVFISLAEPSAAPAPVDSAFAASSFLFSSGCAFRFTGWKLGDLTAGWLLLACYFTTSEDLQELSFVIGSGDRKQRRMRYHYYLIRLLGFVAQGVACVDRLAMADMH